MSSDNYPMFLLNHFYQVNFLLHLFAGRTLTIGITQSGETKDTLDALQRAKLSGGNVSSISNVIGSTISRFTGNGAYLYAGPEYAVASTKAFSNMTVAQILFALSISDEKDQTKRSIIQQLRSLQLKSLLNS